jgi:hypothetical protein
MGFPRRAVFAKLERMKEIMRHRAGRIYLFALLLSIVVFIAALFLGVTEPGPDGEPVVLFGWMTMPLVIGVLFVAFWLVAYLIYFFVFWPYR